MCITDTSNRSASKIHELHLSSRGAFTPDAVCCILCHTAPHIDAFTPDMLLQTYALWCLVVPLGVAQHHIQWEWILKLLSTGFTVPSLQDFKNCFFFQKSPTSWVFGFYWAFLVLVLIFMRFFMWVVDDKCYSHQVNPEMEDDYSVFIANVYCFCTGIALILLKLKLNLQSLRLNSVYLSVTVSIIMICSGGFFVKLYKVSEPCITVAIGPSVVQFTNHQCIHRKKWNGWGHSKQIAWAYNGGLEMEPSGLVGAPWEGRDPGSTPFES